MATQTMDETKTNGIAELNLRDVEPRVGDLVGGRQLYDPCSATDIRRWVIEGPNGDVFMADSYAGTVYLLRDANKDNKIDNASERFTFATSLNRPFGSSMTTGSSLPSVR